MSKADLERKIRKLETELYKQIERGNLLEEKIGRLKFENSTLYTHIQDLRNEVEQLKKQLNKR